MDKRQHKSSYRYYTTVNNANTEVDKDFVDAFTLDDGTGILDIHGDSTIINNYLGTFWKAIMGVRNFGVLHSLVMHTFGTKNQSWLARKAIAEENGLKDAKTVDAAVKELQELGFCRVFNVFDTEKNTYSSNTYVVRRTTPFLSIEQYNKLSKTLKERHNEFINNLITSGRAIVALIPDYPTGENTPSGNIPLPQETPTELPSGKFPLPQNIPSGIFPPPNYSDIPSGNIPLGDEFHEGRGNIPLEVVEKTEHNKNNLEELQVNKSLNNSFIENAHALSELETRLKDEMLNQKNINKQTFNTWINPISVKAVTAGQVYIETPNEFCMRWIEIYYKQQIRTILEGFGLKIQVLHIICKPEQ